MYSIHKRKYDINHEHEGCLWTIFKEIERENRITYIMESKCIVCKIKIYQSYYVTEEWDNRIYTKDSISEWVKMSYNEQV